MLVKDHNKKSTIMDGNFYSAGNFAYSLRVALFKEHFALSESEAEDPLNSQMLNKIHNQA